MKKVGAKECDATFALTFILTAPVTISLPLLFYFLQIFFIKLCWKMVSRL